MQVATSRRYQSFNMNDRDTQNHGDSPSMPIETNKVGATFFACTDTWVLGVILLCSFMLCYSLYLSVFSSHPAPPGGLSRLVLLNIGIWFVFGSAVTPRFIESYTIARKGHYVLSRVISHEDFGIGKHSSTRLNVCYVRNRKRHVAKASVLGKIPKNGSDILVAVHPKKPDKYRVLPYDYLLSRWARLAIIDKIKTLKADSDHTA